MNDQSQPLIKYARLDPYFLQPGEYGKLMKFVRENKLVRIATPAEWLCIKADYLTDKLNRIKSQIVDLRAVQSAG